MRLNKVKILGKTYKITYHPTMESVNTTNKEPLFGEFKFADESIRIFNKLKEFDRLQVLLLEITHGISTTLELNLDEHQVDMIALGFANVLIDNKLIDLGK